jgi:GGDEF domain-containing protein
LVELTPTRQAVAEIVRVASLAAELLAETRHETLFGILDDETARGRITPDELAGLVSRLEPKVAELADVLSLTLAPGRSYLDILAEAHERLAQVASQVVGEWVSQQSGNSATGKNAAMPEGEVQGVSDALANYLRRQGADKRRATPGPSRSDSALREPASPDATLQKALAEAIVGCRQSQRPLSLALVEIDRFEQWTKSVGAEVAAAGAQDLRQACLALDVPGATLARVADARFALVWPDCDRRAAVELGYQILARRTRPATEAGESAAATISVGVATVSVPAKNFRPADLIERASRCLRAAQLTGGNALKSIGA